MFRLDVARRACEENIQIALAAFGLVLAMLLAGCGSGASQHPAATRPPSAEAGQPTTPASAQPVITPGNDTPEDAVDGLIQAELAGNWTQACSYAVPSAQSACSQQASQMPAFSGNGTVAGGVISGGEALVEVTGSICGAGTGCTSNSDPSTGMPNSQETFAQAYSQALSNSNSSFSPVPCIEENGAWYVNFSQ